MEGGAVPPVISPTVLNARDSHTKMLSLALHLIQEWHTALIAASGTSQSVEMKNGITPLVTWHPELGSSRMAWPREWQGICMFPWQQYLHPNIPE